MLHAQDDVRRTPTVNALNWPAPRDFAFRGLGHPASASPTWLPTRIAHADWGTAANKCVVATAELNDGRYHVRLPRTVRAGTDLIQRMRLADHPGLSTLLGFDFPLGVPRAYAQTASITNFADWFRRLELDSAFFNIASDIKEVSTARPFFPMLITDRTPGIKTRFRVALGLGAEEMLRACDRSHCSRPAASEMFWALGPAAVGKMTLAGWKHAIRLALAAPSRRYSIWPFDGPMPHLLEASDAVIVETYPRDAYLQLGLQMGRHGTSKTRQADRAAETPRLVEWCAANAVLPDNDLLDQVLDGFGPHKGGDDLFDAVVGLFGMIDTMRRGAEPDLPDDPAVHLIEGWMFGQHPVCPP
jgi:hypothetical protein